jgi:hypothetical protein
LGGHSYKTSFFNDLGERKLAIAGPQRGVINAFEMRWHTRAHGHRHLRIRADRTGREVHPDWCSVLGATEYGFKTATTRWHSGGKGRFREEGDTLA